MHVLNFDFQHLHGRNHLWRHRSPPHASYAIEAASSTIEASLGFSHVTKDADGTAEVLLMCLHQCRTPLGMKAPCTPAHTFDSTEATHN